MSYIYSNKLCRDALVMLKSDDELESKVSRAFSEMGIAEAQDTSEEIWEKWQKLKGRYGIVVGEIYQQRQEGIDTPHMKEAYNKFAEELEDLIKEWQEYNKKELSKGNRLNKSAK